MAEPDKNSHEDGPPDSGAPAASEPGASHAPGGVPAAPGGAAPEPPRAELTKERPRPGERTPPGHATTPRRRFPLLQILMAITIGMLVWFLLFYAQPEQLPYSVFVELVEKGHVKKIRVSKSLITGRFDRAAARELLDQWHQREKALLEPPDAPKEPVTPAPGEGEAPPPAQPEAEPAESEKPRAKNVRHAYAPPLSGVSEQSYPFLTMRGGLVDDERLAAAMLATNVIVEQQPESELLGYLLPMLLMVALLGALWLFLMRRTDAYGQQVLSFGKSRVRVTAEADTKTTFDDVAGCDEAKEELGEVVAFLQSPERFQRLGGNVPKGVLLIGSPGTGKTLMARAIAGEAKVPFFSLSGSDFVEMFVGVGAARVRDLFQQAKTRAPCIIFIDEIDAVGRQRGVGLGGGNDEREQTLNQLLSEMDGFEPNGGVIVLAATNRPDVLDPALMRPGRFDRQVVIDNADVKGREQILRVHARGKPLAAGADLHEIAKQTPGFSGADLANVMNEAALLAARRNKDEITRDELQEAVERVMAGPERRSRVIRPHEKEVIAYHETGHALVAYFCPRADPVHKISIVPRGHGALGYTMQLPTEDRYILQRAELIDRICVLLGGRVAEEQTFADSSTGAADDLEKVTDLARSMVCRWGMSEAVGPIIYQKSETHPFLGREVRDDRSSYSDGTLEQIDRQVRELVDGCYQRVRTILRDNRDLLEALASRLMEHEVMEGSDFAAFIRERRGGEPRPAAIRGGTKRTVPQPES